MLLEEQVMKVGDGDLGREAGVDRAAAGTGAVHLASGHVRVNNVFRAHAEAFQIGAEERRIGIHAQDAGMPMRIWARRSQRARPSARGGKPGARGERIGDALRMARMPDFTSGALHQVGVSSPGCILPGLNERSESRSSPRLFRNRQE